MKQRNDFVSNSSSCSFIVKIRDKDDVEELEKILEGYPDHNCFSISNYNLVNLNECSEGDLIDIDLGDDNLETIEEFENLKGDILSSPRKFECYRNKLAHYTFGNDLKE